MKKRIDSLQAVRMLAFFEVFSCHILWGSGACGVSIFLILSGFLLSYKHIDIFGGDSEPPMILNAVKYGVLKIKKLYPIHVIMTLYCVLAAIVQKGDIGQILPPMLTQLLLVQSWIPVRDYYFALNGVSWYLSTALFTYLIFPYIKFYLEKKKSIKLVKIIPIVVICVQFAISYTIGFFASSEMVYYVTYICPIYRLGDFVIGICLGVLWSNKQDTKESVRYSTLMEIVSLVLLFVCEELYILNIAPIWIKYQLLFVPVSIIFIWQFAKGNGQVSRLLTNKVTYYFAGISGAGFLVHHKIIGTIRIVSEKLKKGNNDVFIAIVAFIITLITVQIYFKLRYNNGRKANDS